MKKLKTHIARKGMTQAEFAKVIGMSPFSFSRLVNGLRAPTFDEAADIERWTAGGVRVESWPAFRRLGPLLKRRERSDG